jgi:hypothetical protein
MRPALFHVSEEANVGIFDPRPSTLFPLLGSVVWSIAESHLANYLLPRDCPRITFCANQDTTDADRRRFGLDGSSRVVIISNDWAERVRSAALYVYELPSTTFSLHDASAGYWLSQESVVPRRVVLVTDLRSEILKRGADLRAADDLQRIQDEVVVSTVDYSIIRMRNMAR